MMKKTVLIVAEKIRPRPVSWQGAAAGNPCGRYAEPSKSTVIGGGKARGYGTRGPSLIF
jgi:hypothetical protein